MLSVFTKLADFITYSLLGLVSNDRIADAVHFFVEDVTKIFILLLIMTMVVSLFRTKLNPEKVRDYLNGKPKWLAYFLAVLLGAITPFCSCSSIPLFIGFIEAGIPFGVTMSFLITSPLINEVAVIVLASTIGIKFAIIYLITGMILGLFGGLVMEKLGFEKYVEDYVYKIRMGNQNSPQPEKITVWQRISMAWDYSREIINRVWIYIIIGVGLGAFLHGFVPADFFAKYAGENNIFAVPFAALVGIPLYSNATGVIPIAEALLTKGVPIGTVLTMMMSVVAISLPELIILRKVLKPRLLVYFAGMLFLMFVIVGYFYNAIM